MIGEHMGEVVCCRCSNVVRSLLQPSFVQLVHAGLYSLCNTVLSASRGAAAVSRTGIHRLLPQAFVHQKLSDSRTQQGQQQTARSSKHKSHDITCCMHRRERLGYKVTCLLLPPWRVYGKARPSAQLWQLMLPPYSHEVVQSSEACFELP